MSDPEFKEGAPPFLGSWRNVYLLVLGELVLLIVLFKLFMKAFA
ncbi:MAG: hypothetical protein U0P81_05240 [Holophagaceae bacterium]